MGTFPDKYTVDEWNNSVLKLKKSNPGEGKFSIKKSSSEWYTLETPQDVRSFVDSVHEKELKKYKSKSFWLLLDDVSGRNMPIIARQKI